MSKHTQLRDKGGRFDGVVRLEPEVSLSAAPRVPARLAHAIAQRDEAIEHKRQVLAGTVLSTIRNAKGTTHVHRVADDFFLLDENGNFLGKRDASNFNFLWAQSFRGEPHPDGGEVVDVRNPVDGNIKDATREATEAMFAENRETRRAIADIQPPADDAPIRISLAEDGWTVEPELDLGRERLGLDATFEPLVEADEEHRRYFEHIETILNARDGGVSDQWWRQTGAQRTRQRPAPLGEGERDAILVRPSELVPDEDLSREALAERQAERERRRLS